MNYDFKDTNWFKEQVTKIAYKLFICNSKKTIQSCIIKKKSRLENPDGSIVLRKKAL